MKSLPEETRRLMKTNGWNLKQYCLEFLQKKDLLTGENLEYKDYEHYILYDFVDKRNMAKYLKSTDPNEYIDKKITIRKERDGWQYFPSQVECRSLRDIPAINIMIDVGYSFNNELPLKYDYSISLNEKREDIPYLIDTREQKPLKLKNYKIQKLAYGDYCADTLDFNNIFVERKSIQDLWGTLGGGYDRFNKEIQRVKEDGAYLIVLVDYKFSAAMSYNYNKKFSKVSAQFIFKRIRELMQSYDCVQFVFSGGREDSIDILNLIYSNTDHIKQTDIQYILDKGI